MDIYDRLTETEKKWMAEAGYDPICVKHHPAKVTISLLWEQYALRGYTLAETQEMARRLKNQDVIKEALS